MTNDFFEDACDSLEKSGAPYIIIVGIEDSVRMFSSLGDNNLDPLEDWVRSGEMERTFIEHIEMIRNQHDD